MEDKKSEKQSKPIAVPTVSKVLRDGTIVELIQDGLNQETSFVIAKDGVWETAKEFAPSKKMKCIPYSSRNNLLRHRVVLFPSKPEDYGTVDDLLDAIRCYIHRYVDVSESFEEISAYYVLFTWIHDTFNELPYLRTQGDYGTGKTRLLLTIGSICYKPIFASGASTVSPIFHILDSFGGTLLIDEADFRFSDEKAQIIKILNNGNVRGFPILRSEMSATKEFNPRAFNVFGPKIVATRGAYNDKALESRFITEEMGGRPLRTDIPINLPMEQQEEARLIRNKLLLFRIKNRSRKQSEIQLDRSIEPRLAQIFTPLLAIVSSKDAQDRIRHVAYNYAKELQTDRGLDIEARILEAIQRTAAGSHKAPSVKEITETFSMLFGEEFDQVITPKWIGFVIRRTLRIKTQKRNGVFVIPAEESIKLQTLYARYGLNEKEAA